MEYETGSYRQTRRILIMILNARTIRLWLFAVTCCCGCLVPEATATRYQAPIDVSMWSVESSIYECRLSHHIPFYGAAVFEHKAGESATFGLFPKMPRLQSGKASLVAQPPRWRPGGAPIDMGYVPVRRGKTPLRLDAGRAARILTELQGGREIVITRAPWYGAEESSRVVLSNVNFSAAHDQYLDCLAQLLPVNFEQIRRISIYYSSGSKTLSQEEIRKLDNVAVFVAADTGVEAFYIDGHADSNGSRDDNLELSKQRAEAVAAMLVERGVPAELITTRWHGERYPVESNRTARGRSKNRRVTIRLEKEVSPDLPPMASRAGS